ncbi:Uncharacterized protein SCG7086_AA_00580 [Chlamydiales bacterium SCGC AG-110-P3]|nr:Uncharacterized protein SCG7086_AA_00580 [Chlamydiales bacterium SCGC AG-110-P3]
MTITEIEERVDAALNAEECVSFDKARFKEQVNVTINDATQQIDRVVKRYVAFNMAFASLLTVEFALFVIFFTLLAQSSTLAISLAAMFLTLFTYLTLRLYLQARKPEQLLDIRDRFLSSCKEIISYHDGVAEHHMALASACCRVTASLHNREYSFYPPPEKMDFLNPTFLTFSCWWHWRDLHAIREAFMIAAIEEHIKLVKCEPTDLEVHATLANAYVMLSSLYADPRKAEGYDEDRWIPPQRYSEAMRENFRATAERAIQEFKILNEYAPNDPWVHAQLAYSYHDLQMPEEEIKQYETILRISRNDKEALFKLGMLYFQQGRNADGLRIYEQLKGSNYKKAENLIKFYGAY